MAETVESLDEQITELSRRRDELVSARDARGKLLYEALSGHGSLDVVGDWDCRSDWARARFVAAAAALDGLSVPREPRVFKTVNEIPVGVVTYSRARYTVVKLHDGDNTAFEAVNGDSVSNVDGPFTEVLERHE